MKYLGIVRVFQVGTGKYLGKQKILEHKKTNYFCWTKFPNSEKRLQFEVKILFKDHYFLELKLRNLKQIESEDLFVLAFTLNLRQNFFSFL